MAFNISNLTTYIDAAKGTLLVKSVFDANTMKTVQVISGVKSSMLLPKTNASIILQAGGCGWSAAGSTVLGNVTLTVTPIKVNQTWCIDDLNGTAFQNEIKAGAMGEEALPYERQFVDDFIASLAKENEYQVWQGNTSATSGYNLVDGFYKLITVANGAVSAGSLTLTTPADVLAATDTMISLLPVDIQSAEDLVLFMNPSNFIKLAQGIRNVYGLLNLQNSPSDQLGNKIMLPGSNVTVVKAQGLGSSNRFYLGQASNFIIATDMTSDSDSLDIWYSKDNQEVRGAVKYKLGTAVGFIDQIVVSTNA